MRDPVCRTGGARLRYDGRAQSTGCTRVMAVYQAAAFPIADYPHTAKGSLEEIFVGLVKDEKRFVTAYLKPSFAIYLYGWAASSHHPCNPCSPGDLRLLLFSWMFGAAIGGRIYQVRGRCLLAP